MVKHDHFETIILVAIIVSSLKLVFDTYTDNEDPTQAELIKISEIIDMFFTFFFALEALFKAHALGFIMDENSYLRESWS